MSRESRRDLKRMATGPVEPDVRTHQMSAEALATFDLEHAHIPMDDHPNPPSHRSSVIQRHALALRSKGAVRGR